MLLAPHGFAMLVLRYLLLAQAAFLCGRKSVAPVAGEGRKAFPVWISADEETPPVPPASPVADDPTL